MYVTMFQEVFSIVFSISKLGKIQILGARM